MSRDPATLLDIHEAARLAVQFNAGMDKEAFLGDRKTQAAVLHQLLILGEAAKRLSEAFRSQHPSVPWKSIAGMRDKLIHEYNNVDIEEVWKTVSDEIPSLVDYLRPLIPPRGPVARPAAAFCPRRLRPVAAGGTSYALSKPGTSIWTPPLRADWWATMPEAVMARAS